MVKKKKGNGFGKGTFIDTEMFLSDAYLSLGQPGSGLFVSSVSAQILMMLLGKRGFHKKKDKKRANMRWERADDNRFTLTYLEITSYGSRINKKGDRVKGLITQPQATRAFDELLAKGFIEIVEPGGAYEKHKAVYSLSVDYKQWRWGDKPIRLRQKDIRRGFQGSRKGATESIIAHTNVTTHTHTDV